MIKLLLTTSNGVPDKNSGGPNKIIYNLIEKLNKKIFEISFLSYDSYIPSMSDNQMGKDFDKDLKIYSKITSKIYNNLQVYRKLSTSSVNFTRHLKKREKYFSEISGDRKWDIIHSHDVLNMFYISKYFSGIKILTIHSKGTFANDFEYSLNNIKLSGKIKKLLNDMEIMAVKNCDFITFPGVFAKDFFIEESGLPSDYHKKIKVINNGVEFKKSVVVSDKEKIFCKYGIRNNLIKIISVAEHIEPKRIDILINTINELINVRKLKIFLILIGKGPLTKNLKNLTEEFKLNNFIKFVPSLKNEEVLELILHSDIYISTAKKSIYDLSVLEAISSGIKVIADESGGNIEIISDVPNGILIKDMNFKNLSDKIIEIINNPCSEKKLYSNKYSLDNMVENYQKLYMTLKAQSI